MKTVLSFALLVWSLLSFLFAYQAAFTSGHLRILGWAHLEPSMRVAFAAEKDQASFDELIRTAIQNVNDHQPGAINGESSAALSQWLASSITGSERSRLDVLAIIWGVNGVLCLLSSVVLLRAAHAASPSVPT
ncbi:MAG: hypothetical protein K2Y21_02495 [Phycisphaerales bacterium]|nr:hypothetical protein [Phycisphaerales bacterium]